jgi:hypothetical protein
LVTTIRHSVSKGDVQTDWFETSDRKEGSGFQYSRTDSSSS